MHRFLVATVLISGLASAAPACISSEAYEYNSLGSEGCSLGSLTFTDFFYGSVGIGSVENPYITSNGLNRLVLSGLMGGDFAESNGMSLSFEIDGLIRPFSRTTTFSGTCTHDPSEGAPNKGLGLDLGGYSVKSPCEGEPEVYTVTEWFGPSASYSEYGRYAIELAGYAQTGLYSVTVEYSFAEVPEPTILMMTGLGLAGFGIIRFRKNRG